MGKHRLLIICGSTSTGKTRLALNLASKLNGELVSADSRQIYKRMDIGTGKDIPHGSVFEKAVGLRVSGRELGYYTIEGVRVWGYDLAEPNESFSVSQYMLAAREIIRNIWKRNKLPIVVGGSGLYIRGLVWGIETTGILPDQVLRQSLVDKKASELFEILSGLNPEKAASMNASDKNNPRRLVRAIEVAKSSNKFLDVSMDRLTDSNEILYIGLKAAREKLEVKIKARVLDRIHNGIEKEINELVASGVGWDTQALQAIGYKEFGHYLNGDITITEAIRMWTYRETGYARRQITWFKKEKNVVWFDISEPDWKSKVEKLVKKWHN